MLRKEGRDGGRMVQRCGREVAGCVAECGGRDKAGSKREKGMYMVWQGCVRVWNRVSYMSEKAG